MSSEQNAQRKPEQSQSHLLSQLALGGGTVGVGEIVNVMAHNPNALGVSVVLGLVAAVYSEQTIKVGKTVYNQARDLIDQYQEIRSHGEGPKPIKNTLLKIGHIQGPTEQGTAVTPVQKQTGPRRLTIDEIVEMCEYNSFKIYIGSSLTDPDALPVQVSIFKKHYKFIGASQMGKSSMAAAFLDIITRTHDTSRVLIALLDFEDMTSKLFAHLPHLAEVEVNGKHIPLHATTREQVLEHLGYIVELVKIRYAMTKLEIKDEPLLIVYLEEFLALKDYFKSQVKSASGEEEHAQAEKNYTDLVFRIKEIARLGLKARVQLVMCAQVDYADEDFREALANVTNGMSFCVKPTAAQAAGFMNAELLAKNAQAKKVGQAVAETASCNDLVLAPDYDLEARLAAFEEQELEAERRNPNARTSQKSTFLTPVGGHRSARQSQTVTPRPEPVQVTTSNLAMQREAILNLHRTGKIDVLEMADMLLALPVDEPVAVATGTIMEDLPMREYSHSRSQTLTHDQCVSSGYQTGMSANEYVNAPVERVNDRECPREIQEASEPIHGQNSPKFTPEQSAEVLKAYSVLAKDLAKTGQVPTRNALRLWLYENVSKTWNTSQKNYDVFKAICDEYQL